jgi:N-methylhydantoinase B
VPDVAIVTPVFLKGEIIAFSCSIAHKPDVGGLVPGSSGAGAREIFHEGLLMPGVRYWTKNGVVKEVDEIIKRNSRVPEIISGDLRAQVGCTKVGADKLRELCGSYGADIVKASFQELLRLAERRVSDGLKTWPDGESEAEAWVDHDGVDLDKRLRLHVKVIKKGGRISIDFSGSNDQVKGPINLRKQTSEKAAMMALVATLDPTIPFNDGIRRSIDFINPEGKVTNGKWPAPVNSYFGLTHVLKNTISKALVEFCPDRAVACGGLGLGAIALGYEENRSGRKAVQYDLFSSAGGGTSLHDGSSGITMFNGTPNTPIEVIETEFPVRLRRFEWICDSGGPGKFRGGLGNRKDYELLGRATVTVRLGHQFENPGWGVLGGQSSKPVRAFLNPGTDKEVSLRPLQTMTLSAGDIFRVEMPGGGGFGNPYERDPLSVLHDVLDGFVSAESAQSDYGVVVDVAARKIDEIRTAALRGRR